MRRPARAFKGGGVGLRSLGFKSLGFRSLGLRSLGLRSLGFPAASGFRVLRAFRVRVFFWASGLWAFGC